MLAPLFLLSQYLEDSGDVIQVLELKGVAVDSTSDFRLVSLEEEKGQTVDTGKCLFQPRQKSP
jgi:hypothetical protein